MTVTDKHLLTRSVTSDHVQLVMPFQTRDMTLTNDVT